MMAKSGNKSVRMNSFKFNESLSSPRPEDYIDPPIVTKISCVGHSFPPTSQIFIPIADLTPNDLLVFPPTSIHQSLYKTITISNKSDTPLYFRFNSLLTESFRLFPKSGLIKPKEGQIIVVEICPKEVKALEFPVLLTLNHDSRNMKKIVLKGACVDPEIEIVEGNRLYIPPSFVGLTQKQKLHIKNLSPIKININAIIDDIKEGKISIEPSYFDLEGNQQKECELLFTPFKVAEVRTKINLLVSRTYESQLESIGIFNPGSINSKALEMSDKRVIEKSIEILGRGSDGNLTIMPPHIDFGTVKVGFHKKASFSIDNQTNCNFYVKVVYAHEKPGIENILQLDFKEGPINSLCKKEVTIIFKPTFRETFDFDLLIYAEERLTKSDINSFEENKDNNSITKLKAKLSINAKGDYPLLKIVDIRNSMQGTAKLWHSFNVEEANEELLKQLTDEEIDFINYDKNTRNIKLLCKLEITTRNLNASLSILVLTL